MGEYLLIITESRYNYQKLMRALKVKKANRTRSGSTSFITLETKFHTFELNNILIDQAVKFIIVKINNSNTFFDLGDPHVNNKLFGELTQLSNILNSIEMTVRKETNEEKLKRYIETEQYELAAELFKKMKKDDESK